MGSWNISDMTKLEVRGQDTWNPNTLVLPQKRPGGAAAIRKVHDEDACRLLAKISTLLLRKRIRRFIGEFLQTRPLLISFFQCHRHVSTSRLGLHSCRLSGFDFVQQQQVWFGLRPRSDQPSK